MRPDERYHSDQNHSYSEEPDAQVSLRELARVIRDHKRAILLSVIAVSAAFIVAMLTMLALAPVTRMTTLPFRLEFTGADRGEYPNGTKFSPSEVVSTPILVRVYRNNDLENVVPFQKFKSSIFVVESNPALESLEREYRAKFAESKLSTVDRARLEQEFQQKKESIARSYFEISYAETGRFKGLSSGLRKKILHDILSTWAEETVRNKGVVMYDIPVLSSGIFDRTMLDGYDYLIALDILRSKINRIVENTGQLAQIPGAKVVRTAEVPHASLGELRVRLEDQVKFRIEPLVGTILSDGLSRNPENTIEFLQSRLRFNRIERNQAENRSATLLRALQTYQARRAGIADPAMESQSGGNVMPQLDEGFLNRIVAMSGEENDMRFRQELVREIQRESMSVVPLQAEEDYYESLLDSLRGFESRARAATPEELQLIRTQVEQAINEAIRTTDQVNEIYRAVSENLNPSTILFSTTGPAVTSTSSAVSIQRITLIGVLLMLVTLALAVIGSLFHARITGLRTPEDEAPQKQVEKREVAMSGSEQPAELG